MDDDTEQLTAEEQAALDAQRNAPESEAQTPETPQEGAGEPEAAAEGEQTPPADKRPQMVPHAALHEERERRKETERKLAEVERRSEERFKALLEKLRPTPQPTQSTAPAMPDPAQDPAGYIVADMQAKGASIEQMNQRVAAFEQQQQQVQVVAAIQQRTVAQEAEYRAENPDYDAAIASLKQARDRELVALGYVDPGQRQVQIMQEAIGIAAMTIQQGGNVAERLYKLAEARGYVKPAANGEAPAQLDPAVQIQQIAKGQQAARSLGGVRGSGPSPLTAQKVIEMSEAEFDKIKDSPQLRALLGA